MGAPVFNFQDPFVGMLNQALSQGFSGLSQGIGQGLERAGQQREKQGQADALTAILQESVGPGGEIDENAFLLGAVRSPQVGLEKGLAVQKEISSQKAQQRQLGLQERKLELEEGKLFKADRELQQRGEVEAEQASEFAKGFDILSDDSLTLNQQLQKISKEIKDPTVRKELMQEGRSRRSDVPRFPEPQDTIFAQQNAKLFEKQDSQAANALQNLEALKIQEANLGEVKPGSLAGFADLLVPKKFQGLFQTPGSTAFRAAQKQLLSAGKELFGARVTNFDLQILSDMFASLGQSEDANQATIEVQKMFANLKVAEQKIRDEMIEQNPNLVTDPRLNSKIQSRLTPVREIMFNNFKTSEPFINIAKERMKTDEVLIVDRENGILQIKKRKQAEQLLNRLDLPLDLIQDGVIIRQ